jgi:muramoyltetrapeptide carboxypeptidase
LKTLYTITPSWLIEKKKDFTDGVKTLEKLGFKVLNRKVPARLPSPEAKAAELHKAFRDSRVDLLLAQRGGYSSMKMLPYVDFDLIKKHPKLLAGFSDLSTLLNAVYERTGLVTLHAPMVLNLSDPTPFTVHSFMNAVNGFPEKNLFKGAPVKVYRPGKAKGTLKGGNLVTLTALIGTRWDVAVDNAIVFLEDVDEKLHEVDRYLTHWLLTGKLKRIKALILGDFRGTEPDDVFKILSSQIKLSVPVVHCPCIGHVKDKITLPVGAAAALDTAKRSLIIQ